MSAGAAAVPVGQPLHGASFGQAVQRLFRGYALFRGRASRSEFWWAQLFIGVVLLVPIGVILVMSMYVGAPMTNSPSALGGYSDAGGEAAITTILAAGAFYFAAMLAVLLPSYSVMWRRLQDANFHGAFALLNLVNVGVVPFIMCFFPSKPEGIRFDPEHQRRLAAAWQPYGAQQAWAATPAGHLPIHQPLQQQPGVRYGGMQYGGMQYGGQPYGAGQPSGGEPYGGERPRP